MLVTRSQNYLRSEMSRTFADSSFKIWAGSTPISSTIKINVASGGITPPAYLDKPQQPLPEIKRLLRRAWNTRRATELR
jgi:hypothetical protein